MEKFLVTGGAGFIGSNICRRLVSMGCFVRVADNFLTGKRANLADIMDKIEFVQADISDEKTADAVVDGIDIVFHQAALPSVPRSIDDPAASHKNCVEATFNMLMAARKAGVKRFIYAASSSAYGDAAVLPKVETMPARPLSPYAVDKLAGEYYCSVFHRVFGLETISLRYFNVFGPYQNPAGGYAAAIPAFVTAILRQQSPTVYGDGEQTRDFTCVEDVVEANLLAAQAGHTAGEVVNIACGESITINKVIILINKALGSDIKPVYADRRPGDVKDSLADISLAGKIIGYKPTVSFESGLQKAIKWYSENLV